MSALGHKRTSEQVESMSALPPKADIAERDHPVRFVPKADIRVGCYIENKSRGIVRVSLSKLLSRLSVRIGVQQILAGQ
jgi:hypothetical protein